MRKEGRSRTQIRTPRVTPGFCGSAYSSVLFEMGGTRIICAAGVNADVPEHAAKRGAGWITAEYSLLPYSTPARTGRDLFRRDGRAVEIQRIIARSLRGAADLSRMPGCSITIDCDVLQADGGTRTASITGGYIVLCLAVRRMLGESLIAENPLRGPVAAVSVGYVGGEPLLDLNYEEDSRADVDLNVVMDAHGNFIEVQGTAERSSFTRAQLNEMLELAASGIDELLAIQDGYRIS